MRRLVVLCAALLALAGPATALAFRVSPGDAMLVVRNGDNGEGIAPDARPVAVVVVTGFVIGHVSGQGRISIYDTDPTDQTSPEVTANADGYVQRMKSLSTADGTITGTKWAGSDFRFRAVGGTFRVAIWGSGVYLFASSSGSSSPPGWAKLTGNTDPTVPDGQYSLNGGPWTSLPVFKQLVLSPPAGG